MISSVFQKNESSTCSVVYDPEGSNEERPDEECSDGDPDDRRLAQAVDVDDFVATSGDLVYRRRNRVLVIIRRRWKWTLRWNSTF